MTTRSQALLLPLAVMATLLAAGPASAHVTVNPATTPGGGYAKLTFRVPTESDTAATTRVQVVFPATPAFASVSLRPHPGWTARIAKRGSDIASITWTAATRAAAIAPGEFDEFDVMLGPLPESGTVDFKALQTYSDDSVVRWIDLPRAGRDEPEHPAPVLTLTPATTPGAGATAATGGGGPTGLWILSSIGVALGAAALASSLRRRRA